MIVVIGATGRGSADLLRAALLDVGATVLLDGIDVRPGGSLLIAALPDGGVLLVWVATRSPPSAVRRCAPQ